MIPLVSVVRKDDLIKEGKLLHICNEIDMAKIIYT